MTVEFHSVFIVSFGGAVNLRIFQQGDGNPIALTPAAEKWIAIMSN